MALKENLIRSVSFLVGTSDGEERVLVKCKGGRFEHTVSWYTPNTLPAAHYRVSRYNNTRFLSAKELIESVKHGDPVLELMDGSKLRVFLGGSEQMLVMAACIIDSHDAFFAPPPTVW